MSLDKTVLERHVNLGGRRRGLTHCLFHKDDHPSLSVDLDRGVFNCFSCGEQGGLKRFAELVGEPAEFTRRRVNLRPETEAERARREVLAQDRRATAKRVEALPWWFANDHIRRCWNAARDARRIASTLGPEDARTWPLLERAASVEHEGFAIEAELDAILAEGAICE
jgi:hypothetical protein